ncbi:327_t:CDS:2 [Funneliformis mosseae]|uniref:327_t:CDS:1 n=1 Tax=Funneliformis mosseae TaxID=27381 RepID=A0A9N9GJT6_FUNMO|nr:327_t:CDS:2 [Funneliformis mosseae]
MKLTENILPKNLNLTYVIIGISSSVTQFPDAVYDGLLSADNKHIKIADKVCEFATSEEIKYKVAELTICKHSLDFILNKNDN